MIKPLIILFNTISVFLFSFFFGDSPVTVTGNFPKNAAVGTEFTADIIINKSGVSGFAKLQLEVPPGFTVKELESKTGNFSFAGNIAKIIWTSMPSEEQVTVKFTLVADASATGSKTIASKFSYVSNNNKEVVEMPPVEIQIGDIASAPVAVTETTLATTETAPATTTPTEPVTTTATDTQNSTATLSNPSEPLSNVVCSRTITKTSNPDEYNVEVKIKKPAIKGFAKLQEILPAGYNAKSDKTNGSSFSVSDGKAKFVWVSLPAEDEMIVSYTLQRETTDKQEVKLNGEFSYLENDQTKKVKLPADIISSTGDVIAGTTPSTDVTASKSPEPVKTTEPEKTTPTTTQTTAVVAETKTTPTATNSSPNTVVARKEGNVSYVVQVGAFRNAIQSEVLSKKFNISETIKSEMADGYSKFMVGNFGEYKEARNHRENIKQKGCNSAFVAAYNGPKRITVQEALMITSQKWYK
ncbi:MAG: SPOR domain-containing protein [Bacteroidota bacterium]